MMTLRHGIGGILTVLALSGVVAADVERPNIVLLLADDLGWTGLGCFGSDFYETPHLDRLASDGMKFSNAYAACTVCSPTRASIMTGMYPARLHLTDFIAGQNRPYAKLRIPAWTKQLDPSYVTIAEALHAAGYRTGHVGKWHLSGADAKKTGPENQGFDVSYVKPKGARGYTLKNEKSEEGTDYLTDYLTDKACQFIAESHADPFFLFFAYHVPHTPIQGRADLVEYFQGKVNKKAIHKNPVYAAMVASLDQSVGRVLQCLERYKVSERTLVIFTSDNGGLTQRNGKHDGFTDNIPLRRGKGSAYEGGVRVPTIIRWPGVTSKGVTVAQPVMTIDYYPTLLQVAGVKGDEKHLELVDGRSIVPLLQNPHSELRRDLFWHYPHYHAGGDGPYSAIRSGDWRLIQFHEDDRVALYDLSRDIGEKKDLAKRHPAVAQQMRSRLTRWLESVNAQMPTKNDDHDPARETVVARKRRAK